MRTRGTRRVLAVVACSMALSLGLLAGCSGASTNGQPANEGQEVESTESASLEDGESSSPEDDASTTDEGAGETGVTSNEPDEPLANYIAAAEGTINCGQFTFAIPDYWAGKVAVSVDYEGYGPVATIKLPDSDLAVLATISLLSGDEAMVAGDIGTHLVASVKNGKGDHVEVWTTNWPWIAANDSQAGKNMSEDQLAQLVDLSSGGLLSFDELADTDEETLNGAEYGFSSAELAPTVAFG